MDSRALAAVAGVDIDTALEALWGEAAVNTWNARRGRQVAGPVPRTRREASAVPASAARAARFQ
ncbi:hypothetical protein B0T36_23640 [Nocardia donostiensis]|nr:hypothetical protein B0T36_23640 [Nocardia donostiensis]